MSKLTDILDNFRREQEIKSRCTLAQLAEELNKPINLLTEQFADAGVVFSGPDDVVLREHRERLLDWLKSKHSVTRKKKVILRKNPEYSPFGSDWRAVAAGENGAEWECLNRFAGDVIFGQKIHPEQQRLINLIVAKAVIQGALPLRRVGRPKESRTDELAREASYAYWGLVDSGYSSEEAVGILASRFHKTERQIYRYVESQKKSSWRDREGRELERELFRQLTPILTANPDGLRYEIPVPDLSSLTHEDYLDHLDELIATEADAIPDTKDQHFLDSDIDE